MSDTPKWKRGDPHRTTHTDDADVRFVCTIRRDARIHNVYGESQRYVIMKSEDLASDMDKADAHPALLDAAQAVCDHHDKILSNAMNALRELISKETTR